MKKTQSKSTLELLQERSANAVSLIRSTINELKTANDDIVNAKASNLAQIAVLQSTNTSLDALQHDNERVISNFEALLN